MSVYKPKINRTGLPFTSIFNKIEFTEGSYKVKIFSKKISVYKLGGLHIYDLR